MATKTPKAVHAAGVSKVLREDGCERSTRTPSLVKGYPLISAGFKVTKPAWHEEGRYVTVEHILGRAYRNEPDDVQVAKHDARLDRYSRVLTDAGYAVQRKHPNSQRGTLSYRLRYLVVTLPAQEG